MDPAIARRLWTLYEPIHALTYFAPEVTDAWTAAGVTGFWRGYFAGRAAPLGPVPASVVTATFFGFAPTMVERAIPSIWSLIPPERALEVRVAGAVAALDTALAPSAPSPRNAVADDEAEAAALLRDAARAAASTSDGRALAAANAAVPWPTEPRGVLWHAATMLREHRGDGHIAACVAAAVTGLEANVLAVAAGPLTAERFQQVRGWTEGDWAAAVASLRDRSLVDPSGALTPSGVALRASIEDATDRAALRPWLALGPDATARLDALLTPIVARILATGVIPDPNPIGLPRPTP